VAAKVQHVASHARIGLALVACVAALPVAARAPRVDYMLNCMGCHLDDGSATGDRVPALKGEVGKFLHRNGGREYLMRVPGVAQAGIDDASLAALLNWMLETFDPAAIPRDFTPFTAREVGAARRQPYADVPAARAKVLR
jgi:hypothetical protein